MNKLLIVLSLCPFFAFSQDRVDNELPKIVDTIASIKKATGWMKNDVGKWVSKSNAIPSEYSDINTNCIEFLEFQLLKVVYKNEFYFCLINKSKSAINFYLLNFFNAEKIQLADTTINLHFKPICKGVIYAKTNLVKSLINEIYKEFNDENSFAEYDELQINFSISKTKNYLRFFITDKYSSLCGSEETPLEKKYFETTINNFSFFNQLITNN